MTTKSSLATETIATVAAQRTGKATTIQSTSDREERRHRTSSNHMAESVKLRVQFE